MVETARQACLSLQGTRGEPLTVYGDGSQTRSFCFVSDLIEGIYRLLMSNEVEPVNIGNPAELTIREFAERINAITGNPGGIVLKPLPKDDPKQRQPNTQKAREILGWEAKVSRAEGLKITYEYFKSLPKEVLFQREHKDFEKYVR